MFQCGEKSRFLSFSENHLFLRKLGLIVIAILCVAAYSNSFDTPLIRDDVLRIVKDPAIKQFPRCLMHTARPVVNLTLYLNYRLGGYHVAGYHVFNLLAHVIAALFLFGIIRRTVLLSSSSGGGGAGNDTNIRALGIAFSIASLWAVHPIQTESVTYIIQRSESMMGLFYFGCLYAFIRSKGAKHPKIWMATSIALSALGMATKPVIFTLPFAVLLYDRTYVSGSFVQSLKKRHLFYGMLAGTWLVLAGLLLVTTESVRSAGFSAKLISPLRYLITQAGVVLHYLRLVFWPAGLCFDYAWPMAKNISTILPQILVITILLLAMFRLYAKWPKAGFPLIFSFLTLFPTSSFIPLAHYAAEHRMYVPSAGIVAFVVWAASKCWAGLRLRRFATTAHIALLVPLAGILITLTSLTLRRNEDYRSVEDMWRSVLAVRPDNLLAAAALAGELNQRQHFEEAINLCLSTVKQLSYFSTVTTEDLKKASREHRGYEVVDKAILYVDTLNSLGYAYLMQGHMDTAQKYLDEATRLMPKSITAHHNLAVIFTCRGDVNKALKEWFTILDIQPGYAEAHKAIAKIYLAQDKKGEAISHLRKALEFNPDLPAIAAMLEDIQSPGGENSENRK